MKGKSLKLSLIISWIKLFSFLSKKIYFLWFASIFIAIFLGIVELVFLSKISEISDFLKTNNFGVGIELILLSTSLFFLRLLSYASNIILANNLFRELNNKLLFVLYNHNDEAEDISNKIVYIYTHILRVLSKASNQIMEGIASIFVMLFLIIAVLQNIDNRYKPVLVFISFLIVVGPQQIIAPIIKTLNIRFNNLQVEIIKRLKSIEKNVFYDVIHDRDDLIRFWMNNITGKAKATEGLNGFVSGLPRLFIEFMIVVLPLTFIIGSKQFNQDSFAEFKVSLFLLFGYSLQRIIPLTSKVGTAISSLIGSGFEVKYILKILKKSKNSTSIPSQKKDFGIVKILEIKLKDLIVDNFTNNGLKIENITLYPGDILIVKGSSGKGKSSFLNTLSGIKKPLSGEINFNFLNKESLKESVNFRPNKFLAYMSQNFDLDIVPGEEFSGNVWKEYSKSLNVEEIFNRFEKSKFKNMGEMSGGQKQRLLISKLLALGRNLIILDEPSSSLDKKNEKLLIKIIKKDSNLGRIFVIVTHSKELASLGNKFINFE